MASPANLRRTRMTLILLERWDWWNKLSYPGSERRASLACWTSVKPEIRRTTLVAQGAQLRAGLLRVHEVSATVPLPARLGTLGADWLLLPIADRTDSRCRNALLHQCLFSRVSAVLAQRQVVFD